MPESTEALKIHASFQAFAAVKLRYALSRKVGDVNLRCETTQKSEELTENSVFRSGQAILGSYA